MHTELALKSQIKEVLSKLSENRPISTGRAQGSVSKWDVKENSSQRKKKGGERYNADTSVDCTQKMKSRCQTSRTIINPIAKSLSQFVQNVIRKDEMKQPQKKELRENSEDEIELDINGEELEKRSEGSENNEESIPLPRTTLTSLSYFADKRD